MRLDRLTSKFQVAISDAQSLALGRDHQFIEPVHLMTALLNQDGGSIRPLLTLTGMDINALRSRLGEELDRLLTRLAEIRKEEGDTRDDFEVHVISLDAYTVDGIKRLADKGVTDVIVGFRLPYQLGPDTEPLQPKIDHLRRYADSVISKF